VGLFGLQESNPVDADVAPGPTTSYGQTSDPMVGKRIGGVNVFGGGLALYNENHVLVGAIGVSGDTSCADHNIAWRTRQKLELDYVPGGVSARGDDNINYQGLVIVPSLANDFSHPVCKISGEDRVSPISAGPPARPQLKPRAAARACAPPFDGRMSRAVLHCADYVAALSRTQSSVPCWSARGAI
jgi:hypothetical protein